MQILHLCHRKTDVTIGGVAEFLHYLPLSLAKLGFASSIYTQQDEESTELSCVQLNNGVMHYSGEFIKPHLFYFNIRKKLKSILSVCKNEKIDVIHAHGLYRSGFMAQQIYRIAKIPFIITSHSDILKANSQRIQRASVLKRCTSILKDAQAVTHLTPYMAKTSHQIYGTQNKSHIIGNGIAMTEWDAIEQLPEKNYMLAIGRLSAEKGFDILIRAYAKLLQQGSTTTSLVIAGAGAQEEYLQQLVRDLGINLIVESNPLMNFPDSSVIFTGYVRNEIKKKLIKSCKLALFAPQWEEPFGIVQIEAMAAGKVILASATAATDYLCDLGLQAIMIAEFDNPSAWAEEITFWLADSSRKILMEKTNLANAHFFDWDIVAKQYEQVYLSLVNTSTKAANFL